ncbi:hypothetical protein Rsub_12966 [Raphidocelis subcapitata]|uniref:Uncharacterized protein n=1 Tax=Raphidocelis subcapitata TaxID=307507 RepID=A0A2V0PKP4_9CHLO|nr:hypothetical protein Rsub_12966 [Raphidocelis subcapitata]|eukprot:GBG00287.1 hypothetical protein Rsub_12966 [Raphidocelis subcapitata]
MGPAVLRRGGGGDGSGASSSRACPAFSSGSHTSSDHSSQAAVVQCNLLLRLDDPSLEAEFARQDPPLLRRYELAGAVYALLYGGMMASVRASSHRVHGGPHLLRNSAFLMGLPLAHLALMTAAPAAYARRRLRVQLAMRALRIGRHAAMALFSGDGRWWLAKTLDAAAHSGRGPGRTLGITLLTLPLVYLQTSLMHPLPVALQWPLMPLAIVAVWSYTWQPLVATVLRDESLAAVTAPLCSRLRLGLSLFNAGAVAAIGCCCLLQTLALAAVIFVGCLLPLAIVWPLERRARAAFVRERCGGARLEVRPPQPLAAGSGWLQRRGLELPWLAPAGEADLTAPPPAIRIRWATAAVPAAAVFVAWVWLASEFIVMMLDPHCRRLPSGA